MPDWFKQHIELEYIKYISFTHHALNIKNLCLGSSHGSYGFAPWDSNTFNLSGTSQDLYITYSLYCYCANLPLLKNIFVFYSIFSQGFDMIKGNSAHFVPLYKILYNIPYNMPPPRKR